MSILAYTPGTPDADLRAQCSWRSERADRVGVPKPHILRLRNPRDEPSSRFVNRPATQSRCGPRGVAPFLGELCTLDTPDFYSALNLMEHFIEGMRKVGVRD